LSNEDLFRPTLSDYRRVPSIYSSTGFFLSTFFGGPVSAALYGLFNSHRLSRLAVDLPVFVALAAAAFFVVFLFQQSGQMAWLADYFNDSRRATLEFVLRALALACYGAIYLMHRKFFRAAQVSGIKPRSSWVPGIAALLLGYLANRAFIDWILKHH
jgi:hypothetical protein